MRKIFINKQNKEDITGKNEDKSHSDDVLSVAFSPDGRYIATTSIDKTACIWDCETGELIKTFTEHYDSVIGVGFSQDCMRIATVSLDNRMREWDIKTGNLIRTIKEINYFIEGIKFHGLFPFLQSVPNLNDDVTKGFEKEIESRTKIVKGYKISFCNKAYSPDDKQLVIATYSNSVLIRDKNTGSILKELKGFGGKINHIVYSPDGNFLVTASSDSTVRIWDSNSCKLHKTLEWYDELHYLTFSPNNRHIAALASKATIVWDCLTGEITNILKDITTHYYGSLTYSPSGRFIATGSCNGYVRMWATKVKA